MSRTVLSFASGLVLLGTSLAQPPTTQTAVFPSSSSQVNSAGAALLATGVFQAPGENPSPTLNILAAGSPSTTACYTAFGSTTFPAPGNWSLSGAISGAPNMPLALVVGIQPGSMTCGGFAGWPCMTGPLLLGTSSTPWGLHHLGNNPIFILDGIFGTAPPAGTGPGGVLPVAGTGIIDTITNGGVEMSFAIQALVADPLSPSGASLSACLTVSQWVFWL